MPLSSMTEQQFGLLFAKLAIQLRWTDADTASVQSYYEALKDFPLAVLERTARAFATEHGRKWFPTTAEWHEAAQEVQMAALRKAVQPARDEPWHYDDPACQDTGWCSHECDGTQCGRQFPHAPHSYVTLCLCRPTNRTYTRHQRFGSGAAS